MCDLDLPDVLERAAELVHEAWLKTKADAGVTTRTSTWGEELCVPWAALSGRAKDLDRSTVAAVLDAIRPDVVGAVAQRPRNQIAAASAVAQPPTLGPSYMRITTEPAADGESKRQIHVSDTVIVDVAEDDRVLGVECLHGLVDQSVLLDVLRGIRVADPPTTTWGDPPPPGPETTVLTGRTGRVWDRLRDNPDRWERRGGDPSLPGVRTILSWSTLYLTEPKPLTDTSGAAS